MESHAAPDPPPSWHAKWIWHPPCDTMDNFHLLARRVVQLDGQPDDARVWVTANNHYTLWVNGQWIGHGACPTDLNYKYFECYDLATALHAGNNVIAVRCYNYGPGMHSTLSQDPGPGGLLMQLHVDDRPVIATDATWRVLRDPAQHVDTDPITGHRGGFKQVTDLRREPINWHDADFDDHDWPTAHELGDALAWTYDRLLQRDIPHMRCEPLPPRDVFYHTAGCAYGGKRYDVDQPDACARDDDACTIVQPLRGDFAPSLIIDFGVQTYGYFLIDVAECGGGTIEVSYGESLNLTQVDRFNLRPDSRPQICETYERRGARYLMLTFRNCPAPVHVRRVMCLRRSYPVEPRGRFSCSDDKLNRIFDVGAYTVRMCMQDQYEDCPWREQALYCGDLAVSALLSYHAFGVEALARKCLRQFAWIQRDDGAIPPVGPAEWGRYILVEYPAFWLISLFNHWQHWGDESLVHELFGSVRRCLDWYHDRRGADGLFQQRDGDLLGGFVDNLSNISAGNRPVAEDIIYCHALRCAADMAGAIGEATNAQTWQARADQLAHDVESACWSDERRAMRDSADESATITQITNGLALLYDTISVARRGDALAVLLDPDKAPPMRAGYMNHYMLIALAASGRFDAALHRVSEYWGGMLDRGATTFWETFDPGSEPGTLPPRLWSLCHAFCAAPVYYLPAYVAGVRPIEPGFATVAIEPRLQDLHWLDATVPTPRGVVVVSCRQDTNTRCVHMQITLPANMAARVLVPMPSRDGGTVLLNDKPVPPQASHDHLAQVQPRLRAANRHAQGLQLTFAPAGKTQSLTLTTTPENTFAPGAIQVIDPGSSWGTGTPAPRAS